MRGLLESFCADAKGRGLADSDASQQVRVAAYIDQLQGKQAAPSVKQHLACVSARYSTGW